MISDLDDPGGILFSFEYREYWMPPRTDRHFVLYLQMEDSWVPMEEYFLPTHSWPPRTGELRDLCKIWWLSFANSITLQDYLYNI